ncbi:MAG TPA: acetate kinase [Candidatus Gracilibacteria bacterium]|nr:acetate kinase [Candidatus Gracilibacteria bacterium]
MKILVLNAGSSSLKYELFKDGTHLSSLTEGIIDRIGLKGSTANHADALKIALAELIRKKKLQNLDEIAAVGHRVVHGGEKYRNAALITKPVLAEIKKLSKLAPLHNPPNIAGIEACRKLLPKAPNVAVFDTAFHQTLQEKAYLYALPYSLYKKYSIRRYGFHGTSHSYVSKETIRLLRNKRSKIITCHLGNGSSIAAIYDGKSIDTSMGYTPLEGLPMGTRSGDLDPAIVFKLQEMLKLSTTQIDSLLNKSSGLLGFSGISSDMRDLWEKAKKGNKRARETISFLAYRIAKYIGAYSAALNGLDAITFTAGMGEKAWYLRKEVCDYLSYLGVRLDAAKNKKNALEISGKNSKVRVFVVPTDEEKEIAAETQAVLKKRGVKQ